MTEHVILLHGLWMRGVTLWPLAQRLRAAGYEVATFDYASVAASPQRAAARLRERLGKTRADAVHLLGHSLGGLVALEAVRGRNDLPSGRIVCLGSPLRGSAASRALAQWPGTRWLLGASTPLLADGVAAWDDDREIGVIAGNLPLGFGSPLAHLAAPHDGTVAVGETRLAGITDHAIVHASHTGLLLSAAAATHAVEFLRRGHFDPPADP